jgi:hypothetical protein
MGEAARGVKLRAGYEGDNVFEKVLVGVDGKANGRDAIALARQLVDGSTAEYLQRNAPCPLLVLPRGAVANESASQAPARAEGSPDSSASEAAAEATVESIATP